MSFVHDNPEIGNVLTTLGIKKDMFTIFDETNIAILVGMIAYYNQVVLGANTGRITVLYYLFQNMKKEKVKELMQNIDYMVENKKNTRDLKRSMCRALMNYCLKTHQTSRESSGINTERMVESEMNYNGTDYMNRLDREHEENNSDTRNIGNEENYIQWIVSTYKEKNQIFSQQMFT